MLYLVALLPYGHVVLLHANGALLGAQLSLLLGEAGRVELVIALENDDWLGHLCVSDNRAHTRIADGMCFDETTTAGSGIGSEALVWLDHVARGL